ncbi:MAG: hypothetical protein ABIA02_00060 [Candidatus Falkowbacteria bacterium]
MKCEKHNCEMESRSNGIGWGCSEHKICPECEKEKLDKIISEINKIDHEK